MGVIDVSAGFPEACVVKANQKLSCLFDELVGFSEQEQFERLHISLVKWANNTRACLDNLDPQKYVDRNNHLEKTGRLSGMLNSAAHGVLVVRGIETKMKHISHERISDASSRMLECSHEAYSVENMYIRGRSFYNTYLTIPQSLNHAAE